MKPLIPSVIIDCDPGADDFFALLWALGLHKKGTIRVLAITTTGGNVWAETTYKNALRACEFLDIIDIPVGKSDVIVRSPDASHIHGSDGLGEASKYLSRVRIPKISLSSNTLLETIIKKHPEVQILTFWPLTNIAQILKKELYPARIISMWGAIRVPGNVTPNAEFNISYDPESADTVFTTIHHSVLLPLDVTSQLIFTRHEMDTVLNHIKNNSTNAPLIKGRDEWISSRVTKVESLSGGELKGDWIETDKNSVGKIPPTPLSQGGKAQFLEALTLHTFKTNMAFRETAGVEGFLVHDASVVAMLIYPHLFHGQFLPLRVETKGEFTRGQTVTDLRNVAQPSTHTFVVTDVDRDRFMEAMVQDFLSFL